jgi:NitT/TauT family transport system substrate-binding protein
MNTPTTRAGALAVLAAAPLAAAPRIVRAQGAKIRIGSAAVETYAQPYFALDEGFFNRAGLDVEIITFPNAGAIATAAAGGAVDVGMLDMIQLANAVARGIPFVFFAGAAMWNSDAPTHYMCVAKNSTIRSGKDLEGQTVALTALVSLSEVAAREWLRTTGGDLSKIRLLETTFAAMPAGLERGTYAAAFIGEPFLSASADTVQRIGKPYDAIARQFYIGAWFTTREWAGKNPEAARKLAALVYDLARWANTHHNETAPILAKYTKLEIERVRAMQRTTYATNLDPRLMQPVLDAALRYNIVVKQFAAGDLIFRLPGQ